MLALQLSETELNLFTKLAEKTHQSPKFSERNYTLSRFALLPCQAVFDLHSNDLLNSNENGICDVHPWPSQEII